MNEILWTGFLLFDLCLALALFRFFGRLGLFCMIVFNLLLCNIQVLKTIELFGVTMTLGNILYAGIFFATDLLGEYYGKQEARKAVILGFITLLVSMIYMQFALHFVPAPDDFAHPHLEVIFGFLPRIALASMAAYLISQLHDVWAFDFWRRKTEGRHLWLRNNASTMVSQFLDSLVFCTLAFFGMFSFPVWLEILITTYVLKVVVAAVDTPFIYLARRFKPSELA